LVNCGCGVRGEVRLGVVARLNRRRGGDGGTKYPTGEPRTA
jgi:hypothetical protein